MLKNSCILCRGRWMEGLGGGFFDFWGGDGLVSWIENVCYMEKRKVICIYVLIKKIFFVSERV